jgi:hypothetical protein
MNASEKTMRISDLGAEECGDEVPFKRGDCVRWKIYRSLQGIIEDGWLIYQQERMNSAGKPTVTYIIKLTNGATFKAVPSEIELVR